MVKILVAIAEPSLTAVPQTVILMQFRFTKIPTKSQLALDRKSPEIKTRMSLKCSNLIGLAQFADYHYFEPMIERPLRPLEL